MTVIGWGALFLLTWVYDQAADTYARRRGSQMHNPEAFRNIVGRMLEAHGRGFGNQTMRSWKSYANCMN